MKRFQNLLVSVDTRQSAHPALEAAAFLAKATGARLTIFDALAEFSWPVRLALADHVHVREALLQEKRAQLEALADPLRAQGLIVATQAASGKTSVEIIREVLRNKQDLVIRVVKGPQSRQTRFFGNTTWRLFRQCPCPVWAVQADSPTRLRRVLAAIDPAPQDVVHDQLDRMAVEMAHALAQHLNAQFDVIHVWSLFGESVLQGRMREDEFQQVEARARSEVDQAMAKFLAQYQMLPGDHNVHVVKGEPSRTIAEFVNNQGVDLLVLGTVGRSGAAGLVMGNTAEMILSHVQCDVLALKPPGFVSPVTLPKD
jgi:nucleotide-binding universal stress UspA family protein